MASSASPASPASQDLSHYKRELRLLWLATFFGTFPGLMVSWGENLGLGFTVGCGQRMTNCLQTTCFQ